MILSVFSDLFLYIKYLLSGDTTSIIKYRELKEIFKTFKSSRYKYITKDKKITNLFLQKMLNFYNALNEFKIILETTLFDQDENKSQLYLNFFVESFLPEEKRNKREKFTKESMWKKVIESENSSKALKELEDEFNEYKIFLNKNNIPKIEQEYYLLYKLNILGTFNFDFIFNKSDSNFEGTKNPNFLPINGDDLLNELKDFYYLISSLPPKTDLSNAFLKLYRNPEQGKTLGKKAQSGVDKIYKMISDDFSPNILLNMCKYISDNTKLKIKIDLKDLSILDKYKKEIESRFYKNRDYILEKYSEKSLQQDISSLFKNIQLANISGYSKDLQAALEASNQQSISGIQALRVTKTFINEIYETKIKDNINIIVVEGFFNEKEFQSAFSSKFFAANELKEYINIFEDGLSNSGKNSLNYLNQLLKSQSSKNQGSANKVDYLIEQINEKIKHANEKCATILYKLGIDIFKILKDYKLQKPSFINNIKTLKGSQNRDFIANIANSYNDIAKYIKIIKNFITIDSETKS